MTRDSLAPRVRMWRMVLNGVDHRAVEWTPYEDPFVHAVVPGDVVASHQWWGIVCPLLCFAIVEWHQWTHLTLRGFRDPVVPAAPFIPGDVVDGIPEAPDMVQPEDGELPEVHPRVTRRRRVPARRGRGRGQGGPDGSPVRVDEPMQGVHADDGLEFDFGMTDADFGMTDANDGPEPLHIFHTSTCHQLKSTAYNA
ncbi:hypothetical protein PIB30_057509 [Stylosanthes scabra]|uniref:Aminotransferase-like plant mobile domain-containing protein n=1 Tax=Stylosanthes scabra TaxID=79078 RepID=A0ABU6ZIF2_9FABA|nr:hypothetical protein [Stylosanthes scabra]